MVSEGRRNEFLVQGFAPQEVPDPSTYESFDKSRIDFNEAAQGEHAVTLEFYRSLIRLRKSRSELTSPSVRVSCDEGAGVLVLQRDTSILVVNFGTQIVEYPIRRDWNRPRLAIGTEGASLMGHRVTLESESGALCVNACNENH
jgi:maltooligosyltrehalose trehalohydrolase